MEFKKKTIIWEDNNEPPKDYIGAKKDGKFYEYSYATRSGVESKSISGGCNSEESGDSNSTIEAIKNLHVYLTEEGAKKVTNSGTLDYGQGQKNSFLTYVQPSDDWISVPIENYLYVSDMNALKELIEILLSHSGNSYNSQYCIYDRTRNTPYLDTYNSTEGVDCVAVQHSVYQQEEPYAFVGDYVYIYYGEYGPNSMVYPNITLWLDPNDYTKALVHPNDLNGLVN